MIEIRKSLFFRASRRLLTEGFGYADGSVPGGWSEYDSYVAAAPSVGPIYRIAGNELKSNASGNNHLLCRASSARLAAAYSFEFSCRVIPNSGGDSYTQAFLLETPDDNTANKQKGMRIEFGSSSTTLITARLRNETAATEITGAINNVANWTDRSCIMRAAGTVVGRVATVTFTASGVNTLGGNPPPNSSGSVTLTLALSAFDSTRRNVGFQQNGVAATPALRIFSASVGRL